LVVLAGMAERRLVAGGAVDVVLVTGERPLRIGEFDAAVIDPAVALGRDAILDLQLKILRRAAGPDDEGISFHNRFGRDFADQAAVFHAPIFWIAVPTG